MESQEGFEQGPSPGGQSPSGLTVAGASVKEKEKIFWLAWFAFFETGFLSV